MQKSLKYSCHDVTSSYDNGQLPAVTHGTTILNSQQIGGDNGSGKEVSFTIERRVCELIKNPDRKAGSGQAEFAGVFGTTGPSPNRVSGQMISQENLQGSYQL